MKVYAALAWGIVGAIGFASSTGYTSGLETRDMGNQPLSISSAGAKSNNPQIDSLNTLSPEQSEQLQKELKALQLKIEERNKILEELTNE